MSVTGRAFVFMLCAGCLASAEPALAALGGPYGSVAADRARLGAQLHTQAAATHNVHTLTLANGGIVKEFTRADGTVFAVTWRAPGRPDLRQLLGDHFSIFQADNQRLPGRRYRRPMSVNRPDFLVQTGGHSGAFWGVAFLPQLAPPGFSTSDLK